MEAAKKFAMDLNPETADYLTDDIIFLNHDCSKRWELDDNILDVVFSSNFLEHLPNKESIENTISEAYRCLKKNGKVIFLGPNIKYIHGAYWDFWDHCFRAGSILQIEPKGLNGIRNFEQCTSREHAKCFGSIVDD